MARCCTTIMEAYLVHVPQFVFHYHIVIAIINLRGFANFDPIVDTSTQGKMAQCLAQLRDIIRVVRFIYDDTSDILISHVNNDIAYLDVMGNQGAEGARNLGHSGSKGACRGLKRGAVSDSEQLGESSFPGAIENKGMLETDHMSLY